MKHNETPEKRKGVGVTEAPRKYIPSPPKDPVRCEGCPYPGVGFICWSADGTCMKSDVEKISRRSKGR